MVKYHRI